MQQWYQCPRCGAQVAFGARFCGNCQTPLNWPTQQPPPQYQPPPQQQYQQPPQYQQQPQQPGGYQQQPEPPKKKSKLGIISLAIVLFALAAVGSCVVCTMSPSSVTTPTEESTQLSEYSYLTTIGDHSRRMSDALYSVGELCNNPDIFDESWRIKMGARLGLMQVYIEEAREINPPDSMVTIHNKYLEGLDHYYKSTELVDKGIKSLDVNYIDQAIDEMNLGRENINEATELLRSYQ
jgi:hypothetical protein